MNCEDTISLVSKGTLKVLWVGLFVKINQTTQCCRMVLFLEGLLFQNSFQNLAYTLTQWIPSLSPGQ